MKNLVKKFSLCGLLLFINFNLSAVTWGFFVNGLKYMYEQSWSSTTLDMQGPAGGGGGVIIQDIFSDDFLKGFEFSLSGGYGAASSGGNWTIYDQDAIKVNVTSILAKAAITYAFFDRDSFFRPYIGLGAVYQQEDDIFSGTGGYNVAAVENIGYTSQRTTNFGMCFPIGFRLFNVLFFEYSPGFPGQAQTNAGIMISFPSGETQKKKEDSSVDKLMQELTSTAPNEDLISKGDQEYKKGVYLAAAGYYEEAVTGGASAKLYKKLGNCYYYLRDNAKALDAYEKAYELDPNDVKLKNFIIYLKGK